MNKRIIIAILSFFLAILLFAALVLVPLFRGIQKDSKNLEIQYLNVAKASSAEKEAAEFLNFSQVQRENFEIIEGIFVDEETPIGFIQFIEQIARTSNLEVRITPGTPKKKKGAPWPIMDFQLASSARYPDVLRFVEKLENGPYLLEVKNTSLTRDRVFVDTEGSAQDVNLTLRVEVFTTPLLKASQP